MKQQIETVKTALKQGRFTSEAAVSQGIVLPTLNALGWPVFDTEIVIPEYSLEGRRVDFSLCHPRSRPAVFVEVKKPGFSEGADRQLFEYAFHVGVPMAILTDGQEWSFYLPGEQGRYDERRVYKLDLLEREVTEVADRLCRYLKYDRICSGEALRAARSDYQNVAREREIEANFPRAWKTLLDEQDSLLLDLLAEKVEDLCGYKPDLDACGRFVESIQSSSELTSAQTTTSSRQTVSSAPLPQRKSRRQRTVEIFQFHFRGQKYQAKSAREVMSRVFELLSKADAGFLERFAARKHGKKRRYLAKNKTDLYPGRPDLAAIAATEIVPGWWLGTNYSKRDIQKIINLAQEVADPKVAKSLKVKVE